MLSAFPIPLHLRYRMLSASTYCAFVPGLQMALKFSAVFLCSGTAHPLSNIRRLPWCQTAASPQLLSGLWHWGRILDTVDSQLLGNLIPPLRRRKESWQALSTLQVINVLAPGGSKMGEKGGDPHKRVAWVPWAPLSRALNILDPAVLIF